MPVDPLHEQDTHHWMLTLNGIGSRSGTCTPLTGESRYDLYLRIRAEVLDAERLADGPVPVTLFFDLQPNDLAVNGAVAMLKRIARETWAVARYLATGQTRSRKDRRALADYQLYQARERAAERRRD